MRCDCHEHDVLEMPVEEYVRTSLEVKRTAVALHCRDYWRSRAKAAEEERDVWLLRLNTLLVSHGRLVKDVK